MINICHKCGCAHACETICEDGLQFCYDIELSIGSYINNGGCDIMDMSTDCTEGGPTHDIHGDDIGSEWGLAVYPRFDNFSGLDVADSTITVQYLNSSFLGCFWRGDKILTVNAARFLWFAEEVDDVIGCSDEELPYQQQDLSVFLTVVPAMTTVSASYAVMENSTAFPRIFLVAILTVPAGMRRGCVAPYVRLVYGVQFLLFKGSVSLGDFCTLSGDDTIEFTNEVTEADALAVSSSTFDKLTKTIGSGGSATLSLTNVPCHVCYCFALFKSVFNSGLNQWSDPVFIGKQLMAQDTEEGWKWYTDYCAAVYYRKISSIPHACGGSASFCDDMPEGDPPAKPTFVTQCVVDPFLCNCSEPITGLCCCKVYIIQIRVYNGSGYEEFVNIQVSRTTSTCVWTGSEEGDAGTVIGGITSVDGKWQLEISYVALGILVTDLLSDGQSALACPTTDNFTYDTPTVGGGYNFELLAVSCDCPTDCSDCPRYYGLVLRLAGDPFFKIFKLTLDEDTCHWEQERQSDGNWTADLDAYTASSSAGHCYYQITVTQTRDDSTVATWVFQANANLQCPHEVPAFELLSSSVDGGAAAGDLEVYYLAAVKICTDVDATDCPASLDAVFSGTGGDDFGATMTHSGSPFLWESPPIGFSYYIRITCNDFVREATIVYSFPLSGTRRFWQLQTTSRPDCPINETDGWFPINSSSPDTDIGFLSISI